MTNGQGTELSHRDHGIHMEFSTKVMTESNRSFDGLCQQPSGEQTLSEQNLGFGPGDCAYAPHKKQRYIETFTSPAFHSPLEIPVSLSELFTEQWR